MISLRIWIGFCAMDISTLANLVNAIAVTAGVIFAAAQIREFRRQRRRQSMYTLVQTFQSAEFAKALHRIIELPDNLDRAAIRAQVGSEGEDTIYFVSTTWETIGVLWRQNFWSETLPPRTAATTTNRLRSSIPHSQFAQPR